ncbi:MAG: META domain-containing protein, partial [Ardenticatenaceae bacterium]
TTLVFESSEGASDVTPSPELASTAWQLVSLNGEPPIGDKPLTVAFESEGTVVGEAGCNQFGGSYTLDGNRLVVGRLVATRMACSEPQGVMQQEGAYLDALENAATYQMTNGRLELLDAAGETTLVFESSEGASPATPESEATATADASGMDNGAERVEFAPGGTSTVLEGELTPQGSDRYILHAEEGQVLEVNLSPTEGLRLTIEGADGTILADGTEGALFRELLPSTQEYTLALTAGDEAVEYTVNVMIPERISFAPGTTSTTVEGELATHESHAYVFGAQAGQTLDVSVTPAEGVRLVIYGVDGTVLRSGMGEGALFQGPLPSTQDYILTVSAGDQPVTYTLEMEIT